MCIILCYRILCSQLPPDMAEKLMLVASGGIEVGVSFLIITCSFMK